MEPEASRRILYFVFMHIFAIFTLESSERTIFILPKHLQSLTAESPTRIYS